MTWAERVAVRLTVWYRVEPRVRGLVSFLVEVDEREPIPYNAPLSELTANDRTHLVIMLNTEFNLKGITKAERKEWRTYADVVRYVVRRVETFRL